MIEYPALKVTGSLMSHKEVCIASSDFVGLVKNGGIGTAYTSLGESLAKAGHKVTFLYLLGNWFPDKPFDYWKKYYAEKKINLVQLPDYTEYNLWGSWYVRQSYNAYLWLKDKKFDIIHFPEWQGLAYYTVNAKKCGITFEKTSIVIGTHSPTLWHKEGNGEFIDDVDDVIRDFMERKSVELADYVISPSNYMLNWMVENKWNLPTDSFVNQNILPFTSKKEKDKKTRKKIDEVIFFGRLETRKGLELFCDAILKVVQEYKEKIKVTFLGKYGTVNSITADKYLKSFFKDKVKFNVESNFNQPEAMEYIKNSNSIVVIPSLVENSPYTVLECLGAGIPFITSNVGGIPELLKDENKDTTCFDLNSNEISKRILNSLKNGSDIYSPRIEFQETEKIWVQWHNTLKNEIMPNVNNEPKVSVCLIHFNRPNYLKYAIESLKKQDYTNYEVILVDDGSSTKEALDYLLSIENDFKERSWKIVRQKNSYLGKARNTAVANSDGEYIIFMDDDNYAKQNEISTFVKSICSSKADLLTCGIDKFNSNEAPSKQNFLHRWIPLGPSITNGIFENCYGDANLIVSRKAFDIIGGFTTDFGITHEDWEFLAKANLLGLKHLVIPEALFWYRVDNKSMIHTTKSYSNCMRNLRPYINSVPDSLKLLIYYAFGLNMKHSNLLANYEPNLEINNILWKCVEYFEKSNKLKIANDINLNLLKYAKENKDEKLANKIFNYISINENNLSIIHQHPNEVKKNNNVFIASIIILSYNNSYLLDKCLDSIIKNTKQIDNYEIIVVDNGSLDSSKDVLMKYQSKIPIMKVIMNSQNQGFSKGNNEATKLANGKYFLFLNNDTEVTENWIEKLLAMAENDLSIGAIGSKLIYPDKTIQHAGVIITNDKKNGDSLLPHHIYYKEKEKLLEANTKREYQALTAACLLVRRNAFEAVEGFDEKYWNGYEDIDLCFKIRELGWKLVYEPESVVIHHESQSGHDRFIKVKENIALLHSKWLGKIKPDIIIQKNGKIIDPGFKQIRNYTLGISNLTLVNSSYLVSIIFLTYNQIKYTKEFVDSIKQFVNISYELIIVNNASTDETEDYLISLAKNNKNILLINNIENLGFPKAVNRGIKEAKGKYILIANNDIILTEGCLEQLTAISENDAKIGIVGPISNEVSGLQKDNNAKYSTIEEMHRYASKVREKNKGQVIHFPRIAFLCTLIKREVIDKIGGLDERFSPGNYEDDDYCLRAQLAGFKTVIAQDVFIHHYGSKSFKAEGSNKYAELLGINKQKFIDKWGVTPDELWLENKHIKPRQIIYPINTDLFTQYYERAKVNIADCEYQLALESLKSAITAYKSDGNNESAIQLPDLLNIAGNISLVCNDLILAKEYFEEELYINPESSSACVGLGEIFFRNNQMNEAKVMFEWGVKNNPENQAAITSLSKINRKLGLIENNNS